MTIRINYPKTWFRVTNGRKRKTFEIDRYNQVHQKIRKFLLECVQSGKNRITNIHFDAHQYVIQQGGIMSSKPQGALYINFGVNINHQLYGSINYNGYEIKLTPLCILALEQLTLRDPELRPSDRPYKLIKLGESDA